MECILSFLRSKNAGRSAARASAIRNTAMANPEIAETFLFIATFSVSMFSPWGWVEIIAAILVSVGCIGEMYWVFKECPKTEEHAKKEKFEKKKTKMEKLFAVVVAAGVTIEVITLPRNLAEAARLEIQVETLQSNNLVMATRVEELRKDNLELQAKLKTRIISDDERKNFIECLKDQPKGPVQLRFDRGATANVRFYANEIAELLIAAGYSIPGGVDICDIKPILPADTSIEVWTKSMKDGPAYFFPLTNCLTGVADKVVPNINSDPIFFTTNELFIYVANYR